jgi:uncharacterized protein (TIGR03382 family)
MASRTVASLASFVALALGAGLAPSAAAFDRVTIVGGLDFPDGSDAEGPSYFRLAGQSAYYSTRTGSFTSGGQLDGFTSFDSENGSFEVQFVEVFPEQSLTDYLQFGYFGVVETVTVDAVLGETVTDQSLIVAGRFGVLDGLTINQIFPFMTESELVDALLGGFDSPQFFNALFSAVGNPDLLGDIFLAQGEPGGIDEIVRPGENLGLYALIGGVNGDEAVSIGSLSTGVQRVIPTPSSFALAVLAGLVAGRRRRA